MLTKGFVFGVDLGLSSMKAVIFDVDGMPQNIQYADSPRPFIPGQATVTLCELIESMDPGHGSTIVGVALNLHVDVNGRIVNGSGNEPGWVDVPFADWLEVRLKRKVVLGTYKMCSVDKDNPKDLNTYLFPKENSIVYGAASLALNISKSKSLYSFKKRG